MTKMWMDGRRLVRLAAIGCVTLALAGCGGGGGGGGGGEAPPPPTPLFEIDLTLTGGGRVTSSPRGIDCGTTCTAAFVAGTSVELTATPAAGQAFVGWGGACAGPALTCTVSMQASRAVIATFRAVTPATFPLIVEITGSGVVRSVPAGIDCGTTCLAEFAADSSLTLTPTPTAGQTFAFWSGVCAGAGFTCTVRMSQARAVGATFLPQAPARFRLSVSASGNGFVRSLPVGIDCGITCAADFAADASVFLTAVPSIGQVFSGWSGACSGTASTCTVTMSQDLGVSASFAPAPPAPGWGMAQLVESNDDFNIAIPGSSPPILAAVGPNGDAIVMWEQSDGTPSSDTRKVFSRRYVAGQGWDAAVEVPGLTTTSGAQDLVQGRLFLDATGTATFIRLNMETRRFRATSGWSAPISPAFNGAGNLSAAAMDADGNIRVLISGRDVFSNTLPRNGSWGAWVRLDTSGTEPAERAGLALARDGSAIALWREGNPGDNRHSLKAARFNPSTGWQAPQTVDASLDEVSATAPRVAIDDTGHAIALWHQGGAVHHARFVPGAGWGAPTAVETVNLATSTPLGIVMAPDGRAVLAWSAPDFGRNELRLRTMTYAPDVGFSAPETATPYASAWSLGIDDDGHASLVYTSLANLPNPPSANFDLYARTRPWAGPWSAASALDAGMGAVLGDPAVAFNGRGQGVAAWGQNDAANTNVRNSLWANVLR